MIVYKLTDMRGYTMNNTLWSIGTTHRAVGTGNSLGTNGVIHVYLDPQLAIVFNPIHAGFSPCRLWRAEGNIIVADETHAGVKSLTILEELPVPSFTENALIAFALLCTKAVYTESSFTQWADHWLNNSNTRHTLAAVATAVYMATLAVSKAATAVPTYDATVADYYAASAAHHGTLAAHHAAGAYNAVATKHHAAADYHAALAAYNATLAGAALRPPVQLSLTQLLTQAVALTEGTV